MARRAIEPGILRTKTETEMREDSVVTSSE